MAKDKTYKIKQKKVKLGDANDQELKSVDLFVVSVGGYFGMGVTVDDAYASVNDVLEGEDYYSLDI